MRRDVRLIFSASVVVVAIFSAATSFGEQDQPAEWFTAWGTSQQGLSERSVTDVSVRMIARVTLPGEAVRVRLDNTYGEVPLEISSAFVGERMRDAVLLPGTNRQLYFEGLPKVIIPSGGTVYSDPVSMNVAVFQELAVSLYVPGERLFASQHRGARVTSYLTEDNFGDFAHDEAGTFFTRSITSTYWLKAVDVLSTESRGTIVAFGDSITDGSCVVADGYHRWEDWLGVRLNLKPDDRAVGHLYTGIVNEGIGGNTVTFDGLQPSPVSEPGVHRLDRDVLSHSGVTHVVLFMGTNDIRREASADQVISGMQEIMERVKAEGLSIIGATIIPRHNRRAVDDNTGWRPDKTRTRNIVNAWMRTEADFDALLDFDEVVRDPEDPNRIRPVFDCDGIHPSPRGYYEMAQSIPLHLFR